jgi:hypothetical protein
MSVVCRHERGTASSDWDQLYLIDRIWASAFPLSQLRLSRDLVCETFCSIRNIRRRTVPRILVIYSYVFRHRRYHHHHHHLPLLLSTLPDFLRSTGSGIIVWKVAFSESHSAQISTCFAESDSVEINTAPNWSRQFWCLDSVNVVRSDIVSGQYRPHWFHGYPKLW